MEVRTIQLIEKYWTKGISLAELIGLSIFLSVASRILDFPFSAPYIKAGHSNLYAIPHSKAWGFYCVPLSSPIWKSSFWFLVRTDFYFMNLPVYDQKDYLEKKWNSKKSISYFMQLKFYNYSELNIIYISMYLWELSVAWGTTCSCVYELNCSMQVLKKICMIPIANFSFYKCGNWGPEKPYHFPRTTQYLC